MLVFERILNWVVVGGCRLEWFRGLNTFPLGMAIIVLLMLASRQRDANPEKKETEGSQQHTGAYLCVAAQNAQCQRSQRG
jgi:hypothetical protein